MSEGTERRFFLLGIDQIRYHHFLRGGDPAVGICVHLLKESSGSVVCFLHLVFVLFFCSSYREALIIGEKYRAENMWIPSPIF